VDQKSPLRTSHPQEPFRSQRSGHLVAWPPRRKSGPSRRQKLVQWIPPNDCMFARLPLTTKQISSSITSRERKTFWPRFATSFPSHFSRWTIPTVHLEECELPPSPAGACLEAARGHIWTMITISGSRPPLHPQERPDFADRLFPPTHALPVHRNVSAFFPADEILRQPCSCCI